ncbi:glycosyltransferase [Herbaspirillum sp. HC18]|nr:glycosyltransferase [Herbaspirillum sp. HC18]
MQIKAIHQYSPSCVPGDGVTNGMFFTRRLLRELGFESEIYCSNIPEPLASEVNPLGQFKPQEGDLLFMHHSLGYDNVAWLANLTIPKVMVYHNITPPHLLPDEGDVRRLSVLGRQQLVQWAPDYIGAIGDSEYNSMELREANYRNVATIPLLIDTEAIRHAPWDSSSVASLRDAINLLFVGRICENKRQLDLLEVLAELMHYAEQPVRLILAGGISSSSYHERIQSRIRELGLEGNVLFAGKVSNETLYGLYRIADAFVCMSEHEGFGMPLIESMLFDVPVVARGLSSVPHTLGEGGLILKDGDPREAAAVLHTLFSEPALRRRVIAGQRRNMQRFETDHLKRQLVEYLASLDIESPRKPAPVEKNAPKPYWQVEGPFDSSYSLAIVNRELGRALARRGNDVGLRSMEGTGDFEPEQRFLKDNPDCAALVQRARTSHASPDVALRFCYPPTVDDMPAQLRVVHSYGWEETGFPAEYVAAFNRKLDLVTVLSREVEKILRNNGVRIPIAVTGGGVDHLLDIIPQVPEVKMRGFRFLHISSCFPRKGIDVLLEAYGKAFRDSDDVSLVIKTFPNPHNDVEAQLSRLRRQDPGYPEVVLINRDCTQEELVGLYQACHAFVAPSRGEGLGLPMAEAMLFNLPVITNGWGGQTDFCDDSTAWICDYKFARAETHLNTGHSVWADPDADDLARLMREVRDLEPGQRVARTKAARERVLRDFTWDRVAQRTEEAIAAVAAQPLFRREPKIGWITRWNMRCGIASYSAFLATAFPSDRMTVFANRNAERTAPDEPYVVRCWDMTLEESLDDTIQEILSRGIGAVVVQYNFGFFSVATLGRLIRRLHQNNVAVHCFFHATAEFMRGSELITLEAIAGDLALCERIYVHSANDQNRLKGYGLVHNVVPFPQGVLPTPSGSLEGLRQSLGLKNKKVVAAYGFLLPHKGLQQLIRAFALLAKKDAALHLLLVNSLYPAPESEQEEAICRTLIDECRLGSRVTLITDFLTDADSLATLQLADVIVYPYQKTNESSSAAVRMGLAAGRPVAVTPLPIFDDVGDAVHRLPGTEPAQIAEGIRAFLSDPAAMQQQAAKGADWVASRQWPVLSVRLLNLIDGIANNVSIDARHV